MVAEDFLQDPQVREWLDGVEPAWTLLTFESLRALRHEPSAAQTEIRISLALLSTLARYCLECGNLGWFVAALSLMRVCRPNSPHVFCFH